MFSLFSAGEQLMKNLSKLYLIVPYFLLAFGSLTLRVLIPPNIIYGSPHDDLLGVNVAQDILNGNWLGSWNNRTLLKPPGYSYFLVLCHYLHITPHVALHILYILASLYFIYVLSLILKSRFSALLSVFIFAFLILNPFLFTQDFSRIYRLTLHTFLVYLFFILIIHLYSFNRGLDIKLLKFQNSIKIPNKESLLIYKLFAFSLGLVYSFLVLTRVEAFWILYPALFMISILFIFLLINKRFREIKSILSISIIFVLAWQIPIAAVKQVNSVQYRSSVIENYYSGEFARTIKLWTSVKGYETLSIPISKDKREKVYEISKTTNEISKYLEIPANTGWKIFNCQQTGECDESGPWFPFMLRDAVTEHFAITNEFDFQQKFSEIANDIENACLVGKLECEKIITLGGSPDIPKIPKKLIFNNMAIYLGSLVSLNPATQIVYPTKLGSQGELLIWQNVTRITPDISKSETMHRASVEELVNISKKFYRYIYLFLTIILFFPLLYRFRFNLNYLLPMLLLVYCIQCLILFGLGMSVFSATTNNSAGNSLYTLPSAPLFQILLVLNLVFLVNQIESKQVKNSNRK
jgi:hypothetical protein